MIRPVSLMAEGLRPTGRVDEVNRGTQGIVPGEKQRPLIRGEVIFHHHQINTARLGATSIGFADNTHIDLDPASLIIIEDFYYRKLERLARMEITYIKGKMNITGGLSSHQNNMKVHTKGGEVTILGGMASFDQHPSCAGTRIISMAGANSKITLRNTVDEKVITRQGFQACLPDVPGLIGVPMRASQETINKITAATTKTSPDTKQEKRRGAGLGHIKLPRVFEGRHGCLANNGGSALDVVSLVAAGDEVARSRSQSSGTVASLQTNRVGFDPNTVFPIFQGPAPNGTPPNNNGNIKDANGNDILFDYFTIPSSGVPGGFLTLKLFDGVMRQVIDSVNNVTILYLRTASGQVRAITNPPEQFIMEGYLYRLTAPGDPFLPYSRTLYASSVNSGSSEQSGQPAQENTGNSSLGSKLYSRKTHCF